MSPSPSPAPTTQRPASPTPSPHAVRDPRLRHVARARTPDAADDVGRRRLLDRLAPDDWTGERAHALGPGSAGSPTRQARRRRLRGRHPHRAMAPPSEGQTPSDWIAERKAESQVASTEPDDAIDIGASPGVIVSKGSILGNRLHFLCRPRRRGSRVHIPHGRDEVRRGCLQGAVGQRDDRSHRRPLTCDQAEPAHDPAAPAAASTSCTLRANEGTRDLSPCDSQRARPQVLRRVRHAARHGLRQLRQPERLRGPVLRRVRHAARGAPRRPSRRRGAPARASPAAVVGIAGPGRRAPAGLGPVRGPRRLHDTLRGPRPGGRARAPVALLRARAATSSAGTAAPSRSSSATRSWPSGARPTAHEDDAERAVRAGLELVDAVRTLGPGPPGARRRADRARPP